MLSQSGEGWREQDVRFTKLHYTTLDKLLFDLKEGQESPDAVTDSTCNLAGIPTHNAICSLLFTVDECILYSGVFNSLEDKGVFVRAVNFVLLFIERNMHLLPSFAGSEFNILYDAHTTQVVLLQLKNGGVAKAF